MGQRSDESGGIIEYVVSPHARDELARRGLTDAVIAAVLRNPDQRFDVRPGRAVLQSKSQPDARGRVLLVRVFVDVDRNPAEVVTAYRTSKVDKYWRGGI